MAIKGIAQVRKNIQLQLGIKTVERAERAVAIGGSIIAGYATLMTPIDTSVLANSQFKNVTVNGTNVVCTIGYTAKYAGFVHGASGKLAGQPRSSGRGNYWDPDAEPLFLTKAGDDNRDEIDQAVKGAMRI